MRQKIINHYNTLEENTIHIRNENEYTWNHLVSFFNKEGYFDWSKFSLVKLNNGTERELRNFDISEIDRTTSEFRALENNLYFRKVILKTREESIDKLVKQTMDLLDELKDFK